MTPLAWHDAWHHDGWGFGFGLWEAFWSLLWIAFWIAAAVVLIRLVRRDRGASPRPPESHALQVLEERYARGEISRDEFIERREVLRGHSPATGAPTQEL